jgi:hypothetical protein
MCFKGFVALNKVEYIFTRFVMWALVSMTLGVSLAILFGGRGGELFFILTFIAGSIIGFARCLYIAFSKSVTFKSPIGIRLYITRFFTIVFYLLIIYTIITNWFINT